MKKKSQMGKQVTQLRCESHERNSMEYFESEITHLQLRLLKILQDEYSLCAIKEIILRELEKYQCKMDSIRKTSSIYQSQRIS